MIALEKSWPGESISLKKTYQFVIIGGGLIGCALFSDLSAKFGNEVLLIESNSEPISIYTNGNNGYLTTRINSTPNTVEFECIKRGRERFNEIVDSFTSKGEQTPFLYQNNGTLLVAYTKEEKQELRKIEEKYKMMGIDAKLLNKNEVFDYEPNLRHENTAEDQEKRKVRGAVFISDEYAVLDPHLFLLYLLNQSIQNGSKILCNTVISSAQYLNDDQLWKLSCSLNPSHPQNLHNHLLDIVIKSKFIINASEINFDSIERIILKNSFPNHSIISQTIPPLRGQYLVFEKESSNILNGTIQTISQLSSSSSNKSIIISKSVYGNIVVGPTFDSSDDQQSFDEDDLLEEAHRILSQLSDYRVIGSYTALRPGTEYMEGDYAVECTPELNYLRVGGMRLSAISACLGVSEHVLNLFNQIFGKSLSPIINSKL